jgi:hypothetical protein
MDEYRRGLRSFYPDIPDDATVEIVHFRVRDPGARTGAWG